MASGNYLFTSESVSMGHPDKVSDQISDAIVDDILAHDENPGDARVAVETLCTTGQVVVAGEVRTSHYVDVQKVVRETIKKIGYTDPSIGFSHDCGVLNAIHEQSVDIAQGVDKASDVEGEQGAGDQGLMFGYACNETDVLMPLPIHLSHRIVEKLAELRESGEISWLRPDSKSQVTVEYTADNKPVRIDTVVVSTQHDESILADCGQVITDAAKQEMIEKAIKPCLPAEYVSGDITYHINPTGKFVIGGPHGDTGLTGRKIIVDTYGGRGRHGGGAFSGKDPSKVDRSAAYMARYVAKNIVAASARRRGRGAARLRHRRRRARERQRQHVRHRQDRRRTAHRPDPRQLQPHAAWPDQGARPHQARDERHRRPRPLRPRARPERRVQLGKDRQSRGPRQGRRVACCSKLKRIDQREHRAH